MGAETKSRAARRAVRGGDTFDGIESVPNSNWKIYRELIITRYHSSFDISSGRQLYHFDSCYHATERMSDDAGQRDSHQLNRYLTGGETVERVSRGSTRTFAVTDRRLLDITQGRTSEGRPAEFVQSTLFSNVARVNISIEDTITEVDVIQRILAAAAAIIGLLLLVAGAAIDAGDASGLLVLVGLVLMAIGAWLWITATKESPGGIVIALYHASPREESKVTYTLPEDQTETARAVVRMVGHASGDTGSVPPADVRE